jgi:hypothetical protein
MRNRSDLTALAGVLAVGYWLWSVFIAVGAGFVGAGLQTDCGREQGCDHDAPPPLEPWRWSDYYVFPEASYVGAAGVAAASAALFLVFKYKPLLAASMLLVSLVLLSYPFFGGLTVSGRAIFSFGFLLGVGALALMLVTVVAAPFRSA